MNKNTIRNEQLNMDPILMKNGPESAHS